jgi:hypothetical protein
LTGPSPALIVDFSHDYYSTFKQVKGPHVDPEIEPVGVPRRIARRVLLYVGAFLALPGIGIFAWEMLLRTGQPGEEFRWTPMLLAGGFVVFGNLAFMAAGKLGALQASSWIKGVGMACLAMVIGNQVNRTKQDQPEAGKPKLMGRELLKP